MLCHQQGVSWLRRLLRPEGLEPHDAGDRRALVIVVALNLAMGVSEMTGSIIAGSQALKADAVDFLGDGLITLLGLLAIGWRTFWRARAALLQGLFLAALGVGVIGTAV